VDINPSTLNLDPARLEAAITAKTRAIVAVHTFGRPADLDPILEIARKHRLPVIEDACEALGAQYRGRAVGGIGTLGVFGFYPNKPITTGEGGMVVTRDPGLAKQIRALRNHGRSPDDGWIEHRLSGYNYRLSEINCALGVAQMSRLPEILKRREEVAARYSTELRGISEVSAPPVEIPNARQCWFVYVVRLSERFTRAERDAVCIQLNAVGIGCGRYFPPLHLQPLYAPYAAGRELPITEHVAARTLALPFFNRLTGEQIVDVCRGLKDAIGMVLQARNT
jgi:perosamine synthetase